MSVWAGLRVTTALPINGPVLLGAGPQAVAVGYCRAMVWVRQGVTALRWCVTRCAIWAVALHEHERAVSRHGRSPLRHCAAGNGWISRPGWPPYDLACTRFGAGRFVGRACQKRTTAWKPWGGWAPLLRRLAHHCRCRVGSQAAIQALPRVFPEGAWAVIEPCYAEPSASCSAPGIRWLAGVDRRRVISWSVLDLLVGGQSEQPLRPVSGY